MKQKLSRCFLLAGLTVSALLAACASPDGLRPRAQAIDPTALAAKDSLARGLGSADGWPASQWWQGFGDPQLDHLIGAALAGNPSLAVARARIEQADALTAAADAGRRSQLGGSASIDRQRYTEHGIFPPPIAGASFTTGQLALNFSHEFDFWGRQRAALDAALSRARAAAVEAEAAKLTLAAAVARSYVELDHQHALRDVAEATLKQRERIRELTQARVGAGLQTRTDLQQTVSAMFAARTEMAASKERIALLKDELAALAGKGPDWGLTIVRPKLDQAPVDQIPANLPAELLGRRADIVAQRLRVEAAGGDVASAHARFYPNIDLAAFVGLQSVDLDQLLKVGNRMLDAKAAISLPIFDGGRLRANLAARNAEFDLAVEQYNGTLIEALHDVVDQLTSWQAIDLQSTEQRQAQAAAEEAYRLAQMLYQGELSSYLNVLGSETQVLAQRRLSADLRARRLAVSISLARALGGGFQSSPPAAAHPSKLQRITEVSQ